MRAVIQRVSRSQVKVSGNVVAEIGPGLLVFLGVGKEDTFADAEFLLEKIVNLRIFADQAGKFNLSLLDCGGGDDGSFPIYPVCGLPSGPASFIYGRGTCGDGPPSLRAFFRESSPKRSAGGYWYFSGPHGNRIN